MVRNQIHFANPAPSCVPAGYRQGSKELESPWPWAEDSPGVSRTWAFWRSWSRNGSRSRPSREPALAACWGQPTRTDFRSASCAKSAGRFACATLSAFSGPPISRRAATASANSSGNGSRPARVEELCIPTAIITTDIDTCAPYVFTRGPLEVAIRATCAFPGLFQPVEHEGRLLADGCLVAPVPTAVAARMKALCVAGSCRGFEHKGRVFSRRRLEPSWRVCQAVAPGARSRGQLRSERPAGAFLVAARGPAAGAGRI